MYSIRCFFLFERKNYFSIFSLVFFIAALSSVSAQNDVNNEELLQHQQSVEFINNNGMPARIDSRSAIWGIGGGLGRAISRGADRAGDIRYFLIHCASDEESKLGADILGLGENAGVDHIRNLRLIIQGYLESAYRYSPDDAALLARYITIYNAVFRKNIDYFNKHYAKTVLSNLTADKAGLSNRYTEWAGQTLIVIPLGNAEPDSLSAVNTTPLTDPKVIDEMRKDPDKDIDSRKDMVDLKEREAEEAEKKALEKSKEAEKKEAGVNDERKKLEEEKSGGDKNAIVQKEKELGKQEDEAARQREDAKKDQDFADKKTAEARQDREEIAKDQQEMSGEEIAKLQPEEATADESPKGQVLLLGTVLNNASSSLGKIVQLEAGTGKQVNASPTALDMRTLYIIDNAIIALASQNDSSYRLVKIDASSLETLTQGEEVIGANSLLWVNNKDIYAIATPLGGKSFSIARFDTNLKLQASSTVPAHPFASVLFNDKRLITQRSDGTTLFLNPQDLTETSLTTP